MVWSEQSGKGGTPQLKSRVPLSQMMSSVQSSLEGTAEEIQHDLSQSVGSML